MKEVKKWKKHLQSIGFPNLEKLSDGKIMDVIYTNVPGRLELLKWLAFKISEEDDKCFEMTLEDISSYFCELGLLKRNSAYDFINARCTEKEQKSDWKVIFSYTRMKKYFSSMKNKRENPSGREVKLKYSDRPLLNTMREIDYESDSSTNVREEIEDVKKEIEKIKKKSLPIQIEVDSINYQNSDGNKQIEIHKELRNADKALIKLNNSKVTKFKNAFMPMLFTPNMKDFLAECRAKSKDQSGKNVLAVENTPLDFENVPRLFIPPGAPPLGKLENDPSKYKIKIEVSTPPIGTDGEPHSDFSSWDYKIYHVKK